MGFVAMILAAGVAIAIWMARAERTADAARSVIDLAGDAKAAARRFGYKRRTKHHPLDDVDDPRLAAAGMMVAMARLDGDLTRDQAERITRECLEAFEVASDEANDMTAFGRWLAAQGEPEEVMRRLARSLRGHMDEARRTSLYAMLERVGSVEEGGLSERQNLAIDMVRRTFG